MVHHRNRTADPLLERPLQVVATASKVQPGELDSHRPGHSTCVAGFCPEMLAAASTIYIFQSAGIPMQVLQPGMLSSGLEANLA